MQVGEENSVHNVEDNFVMLNVVHLERKLSKFLWLREDDGGAKGLLLLQNFLPMDNFLWLFAYF
jgi:hypothetical protein